MQEQSVENKDEVNAKERERKAAEFAQYPEKQRARKAAEYAHNSKKEQERKHHVCKDNLSTNVYDVKPIGCLVVTERNCTKPLLSHSFLWGLHFLVNVLLELPVLLGARDDCNG